MKITRRFSFSLFIAVLLSLFTSSSLLLAQAAAAAKALGTVESVNGNKLAVKNDAGGSVNVTAGDNTKVLQVAPGQTMKDATATTLSQLQSGDRVLVRGTSSSDGIDATTIVVMKQAAVAQHQQQDVRDWQQRGVGGIVASVDAATGDIKLKSGAAGTITVHTTPKTSFLRYAPNSIEFKDAVKSSLPEVKPGDQLRARGDKSADGTSVEADEVIAGTFRNIAGTVVSMDTTQNSVQVADLATKKTVEVKITPQTQMHRLPPMMAQRVAMLLKGAPQTGGTSAGPSRAGAGAAAAAANEQGQQSGARARSADFQQMLSRTPAVTVGDLKKGDAVMVVATSGSDSEVSAITFISGVEPILTAAPNGSGAAELLSNWNISTSMADMGPQ